MNKARIGIIGVGWWGTVGHLAPLSEDPQTELVAVFSRTEEKAKERAEQYGVPRYYTDYRRMIDECDLDGVVIATTPNMHYEQALYALEHGLHVLMEKPFVLKAEHAEHLQQVAQEKGLKLSVCHPMIYPSWMAEMRQAIQSGALGNILTVSTIFSQRTIELYRGEQLVHRRSTDQPRPNVASYSDPSIVGGGEGHTQTTHPVGIMLWLTGLQPTSVFAYMNNLDLPLDVVNGILVRFDGGALGTVTTSGLIPPRGFVYQITVIGDEGTITMDAATRSVFIRGKGDEEPRKIELTYERHTLGQVPQNFVRAILGEEEQYVSTDIAINEVRIIDGAYRSAATGQEIALNPKTGE